MSRSQGRATAQNFTEFAQNLENGMCKLKIYAFYPLFMFFFLIIHTYYVILGVTLFLAQNFRTNVLTAQKRYF